jgi:predicted nucleotidyltransferase
MELSYSDIERKIKAVKPELEAEFGVRKIGIFGSYAKGLQTEKSDIDIIVEIERPMGLIGFIKIEQYLSRLLRRSVDLLTPESIKPFLREDILKEVKYV